MASNPFVTGFILWTVHRTRRERYRPIRVVTHGGDRLFQRFEFLWPDEYLGQFTDGSERMVHALPWWRPFNAFVHRWCPAENLREAVHDHPRWSITICLRGRIIERTPWDERLLKPGSIVIRSHKAIHSFEVPKGFRGKTWTLFIVGRRKHRQNTYAVSPQ
ncbi:MAG: hypothetical protein ACTHMO_03875 [Rhodanobacteraceae bacterium]